MEKSKKQWVNILRWISVFPIVIIVYLIFKIIYSYLASFVVSETLSLMLKDFSDNGYNAYNYISEIDKVQGFAGHYIIGSAYIFSRELLGVTIAIFSGIYIAPTHKRQVGFFLTVLLIIFSIFLVGFMIKTRSQFFYSTEIIIRIIIEYLGMISGVYIIWKFLPEVKKQQ